MITDFITIELPLSSLRAIESELQKFGEPLRWAITRITADRIEIEAVVTRE
jgi:hypothetical protein